MTIGLVAATIRNNKIDEQINEIEQYLSNNHNCDLLCFGEAYLHGFHGMSWEYEIDINRAITLDSQSMEELKGLAKEYDCGISFGYIEKFSNKIYSSNIVIDNNGNILDNYRRISEGWKCNWENEHYAEGSSFQVFTYKGKQFVTAICGDFWWDYLIKEIENLSKKVDVVLWPLYIDYSPESWATNARQEYVNQVSSIHCPVLMINSYSPDENEGKGGCCVFNQGHIENELPVGERGILIKKI